MDNTDSIVEIVEEAQQFLQTVETQTAVIVKLAEFENENNDKPKSKLLRLLFLKYKCIFFLSLIFTVLIQFFHEVVEKYFLSNETKAMLTILTNETKTNNREIEIVNLLHLVMDMLNKTQENNLK